jgi:deazaflavin-dependent oxidoreductase (nitroreductase family)
MPIPLAIGRFNRVVTNRLLGPIVWFVPGFGRIEHVGRRTGRSYRTPIMAFRSRDRRELAFALTYGPETEWVQNVLAAGGGRFDSWWTGPIRLCEPRLLHDPARRLVPRPIRFALRLLGAADFLVARTAG